MFKIFQAKKTEAPVLMDEVLGVPFGAPGSPEAAAWTLAEADRKARQSLAIEESTWNGEW